MSNGTNELTSSARVYYAPVNAKQGSGTSARSCSHHGLLDNCAATGELYTLRHGPTFQMKCQMLLA